MNDLRKFDRFIFSRDHYQKFSLSQSRHATISLDTNM